MSDDAGGLPRIDPARVADAIDALAERVADADARAQLHATAGIVRNLVAPPAPPGAADALAALGAAERAGDDDAVVEAIARLAAAERALLRPVDWTAASGG